MGGREIGKAWTTISLLVSIHVRKFVQSRISRAIGILERLAATLVVLQGKSFAGKYVVYHPRALDNPFSGPCFRNHFENALAYWP